jgi:peptidoglycan-associated lipoprotein
MKHILTIGLTALISAVPTVARAQDRGTVEFGAFASAATFDHSIGLNSAGGGGGRIGAYLDPRWVMEFEDGLMRASRPLGLEHANVGLLSGRLVFIPTKVGSFALLVGAGAGVSTETNFFHTYGVDGLVGAKVELRPNVALRVDGVFDWMANYKWKNYQSVRVGLSVTRRPFREVRMIHDTTTITRTVVTPAPPAPPAVMMPFADSVSAAETRRLRQREAALTALRDSLRNTPPRPVVLPTTLSTMEARIHFDFDKSVLTDSAKAILDDKVTVFRANPSLTIVVLGFTDLIGRNEYNLALGERRALAAKAYIVAKGIDATRIIVESKGDTQPLTEAPGKDGQAPNRRAVFRLLMAPDGSR